MKKVSLFLFSFLVLTIFPSLSNGEDLPRIAVWDLEPRNTPATHSRELTSFVVSEISKLKKYEVYSQENVRTLAGWTAERMQLGCTDTKCLLALGQMDVAKLISGSVGKIGNRYTVSLNLFDTQNARAENALSKTCQSEDELIELIQTAVRELLREGLETPAAKPVSTLKNNILENKIFLFEDCYFGTGAYKYFLKFRPMGLVEIAFPQMGGTPGAFEKAPAQWSIKGNSLFISWNSSRLLIRSNYDYQALMEINLEIEGNMGFKTHLSLSGEPSGRTVYGSSMECRMKKYPF